jgi:hypothetical protein
VLAVRVSGVSGGSLIKSVSKEYPEYKIKESKRSYGLY